MRVARLSGWQWRSGSKSPRAPTVVRRAIPTALCHKELELMVRYGATPMQALIYGTSAAADLLGLAEKTGTLEPGKRADIIAVSGNPLEGVGALRAVRVVVRGGESMVSSGAVDRSARTSAAGGSENK